MPSFLSLKCKPFFILLLTVLSVLTVRAQESDGSRLRISLLTCSPGQELYATFGHSALRVIDSNAVNDLVYNYGTFDFNDPNFYSKFIRGKLMYYLNVDQYQEFVFGYAMENRSVTEQVLELTAAEKQKLRLALNENLKEENKFYLYDFFLDNCTTRLRDLIENNKTPKPIFLPVMDTKTTFRNAIHLYLDSNKQDWSKLGIDLLLGAPCDAVMTVRQQAFLPDNLMNSLDIIPNINLVKEKSIVSPKIPTEETENLITPMTCSLALLIFFVLLTLLSYKFKIWATILNGFDFLLFISTGLLGCLFIFMMLGTDHSMTKQNYNILWAVPFNLIAAFFVHSKRRRAVLYFLCNAILQVCLLALWVLLPQELNAALIPISLLLLLRSADIYVQGRKKRTNSYA